MKGKNKKNNNFNLSKIIKLSIVAIGLLLVILGFFITDISVALKIIGVSLMTIIALIESIKSEKYSILKSILTIFASGLLLSWLVPSGAFSGSVYSDYGMVRIGLTDISNIIYNATYFSLDKIIYLFVIGAFYAVISKSKGYQNLVIGIGKKIEKRKIVSAITISIIFMALTTLISQLFIVLTFVPFFITILTKAKFDKLTAFAATIGAILVGTVGVLYGTEGLYWFSYYANISLVETGLTYRLIVLAAVVVLYSLFMYLRLKGINSKKDFELIEDPFETDKGDKKSNPVVPAILLILTTVLLILGYVAWTTNFEITVFDELHTWLTGLTVGEENLVMSYILGSGAKAFGSWDILAGIITLSIMTIIAGLIAKMNINNFFDSVKSGFKVMAKPALYVVLAFAIFITVYICGYTITVSDFMFGLSDTLNPNVVALNAFFTSIFHVDFGYTGYAVGPYLTSVYADSLDIVSTIYISMYGFAQIFLPSSAILVLGLKLAKIEYRSWIKYISLFLVGLLIVLLVIFNISTYLI